MVAITTFTDVAIGLTRFYVEDYFKPSFIKGRVVNSLGDGIGNATIHMDVGAETKTTASGFFFLAVASGKHTVTVSYPEYFPDEKSVTMKREAEIVANFSLTPIHKNWRFSLQEMRPF